MIQNSIARKVLYPAAATALVIGGTVAAGPANALLSDNVHDIGSGGMTNCNGGDVCVKEVGDELEVSYEVQFGNGVKSSDHGQTVKGNMIAFPSVMKDAKLEVVATGKNSSGEDNRAPVTETDGYPTHKFDKPVEVPVYTPEELEKKNVPYDGGEISFVLPDGADEDKDSSYVKKYSPDNKEEKNEDRFFATHLKGENIINDFKKNGGSGDEVKGIGTDGVSKDSIFYDKSLEKAGAMPTDSPYDYFVFNSDSIGVQTFKVTGKVKTESDLSYLPIRAKGGFYKCGQEGSGFGITDKDTWTEVPNPDDKDSTKSLERNDCRNLMDYEWARSDDTLPHYSLENNEVTKSNIKNDTEHGLMGSKKCAVTEDDGRYDRIEQDIEPRTLRSGSQSTSWGAEYARENRLHANRAVTYLVGGYLTAEDNCDQAGVKISLCNEDKPDEAPSTTPEETPTTTPNESTSKTTTPEHPSKSSTPKTDSVKTETPSSEKTTTPVESPETSTVKTDTNTQESVKTTPSVPGETPGATPGKTTNFGHNAPHPKQDVVAVDSPEKATAGPEVNTGGEVESTSLFAKVINIFK